MRRFCYRNFLRQLRFEPASNITNFIVEMLLLMERNKQGIKYEIVIKDRCAYKSKPLWYCYKSVELTQLQSFVSRERAQNPFHHNKNERIVSAVVLTVQCFTSYTVLFSSFFWQKSCCTFLLIHYESFKMR